MRQITSEKQIAANRRNALKSTGPRTAAGRAVSSRNALKHGLLSQQLLVHGLPLEENEDELNTLFQRFRDDLQPVGEVEETLVDQIVIAHWRLRRALQVEAAEIALNLERAARLYQAEHEVTRQAGLAAALLPSAPVLDKIQRYESRHQRQMDRAITELERAQQMRGAQHEDSNSAKRTHLPEHSPSHTPRSASPLPASPSAAAIQPIFAKRTHLKTTGAPIPSPFHPARSATSSYPRPSLPPTAHRPRRSPADPLPARAPPG